ncbi:hypothetical protein HC762_00175 [bacterium]|nr:hypothetical protein [bacterium]
MALFGTFQSRLGSPTLRAFGGLPERTPQGRNQTGEPILEHVVRGALLERLDGSLFSDGAGNEMKGTSGRVSAAMDKASRPSKPGGAMPCPSSPPP